MSVTLNILDTWQDNGKTILEDSHALGQCVETAIIGHLFAHCSSRQARFSYWRSHKEKEVDLIVEMGGTLIPFEVKYQSQHLQERDVPGLTDLCLQKPSIQQAYVLTKAPQDIGKMENASTDTRFVRIPAALFCYWLGAADSAQKDILLRSP